MTVFANLLAKYFPESDISTTVFPPSSTFSTERDVPDVTGKIFIVTGGNSGIGYETIKVLLPKGGKVYLAARSEEKAQAAIAKLIEEVGGADRLFFLKLDLGDLSSVKASAQEFLQKEKRLDVLINNAGVMLNPNEMVTAQDYDLQFGTNVLGHYYFTKLLIPALLASYEATSIPSRIINLSSCMHRWAPDGTGFDTRTLVKGPERDAIIKSWGFMASTKLYGQSKLGNIFISSIFSEAYKGKIVAVSIHPGGLRTELQRHYKKSAGRLSGISTLIMNSMLWPAPMGAYNTLFAATVAAPEEVDGKYIVPWTRIGNASQQAKNKETQEAVRQWLEKALLPF